MKGAVERIIEACANVQTADGLAPLDEAMEADILSHVEALAEQGLRVLGLAQKSWTGGKEGGDPKRPDVEANMTLVGLVGLYGAFLRSWRRSSLADVVTQILLVPRLRELFVAATTPVSRSTCSLEITPPPLAPSRSR